MDYTDVKIMTYYYQKAYKLLCGQYIGVRAYRMARFAAATTVTGSLQIGHLPLNQSQSVLHDISQNTL